MNDEPHENRMKLCLPALLAAMVITLVVTVYPHILSDRSGKADHGMAMLVFWAMSAGYVRGVGFVPHSLLLRWLFSGWAVLLALAGALALFYSGHYL